MSFVNRVCDKVYVINMEKDKERLKTFDGYMKDNNILYERFNAVNGSKVLHDDRLTNHCNIFCSDGVKGCALSHRTIWDTMIKNNYKNVLIFEDDAIVDKNFDRSFNDIWNELPKDYDVVYFGSIFGGTDNSINNSIYKKLMGFETEKLTDSIFKTKGTAGTHCLMISLEGAKKFVDKKINYHIDTQMMWWIRDFKYNAYIIHPNMIETSQDNGSLSDTYPNLLNSVLKQFTINNLKKPSTLDWTLNEPIIKIGWYNLTTLLLLLMIIVALLPRKYYYIFLIWLTVELIYSRDLKNTFRYFLFLGLPMGLKIYYYKK